MSVPQSSSSAAAAIAMSDLEAGKKGVNITVTSVDSPQRPMIGRRKTSEKTEINGVEQHLGYAAQEDNLTKAGNFIYKIHSASILT